MDVNIELKERWYIFPLPYVKPVDRRAATGLAAGRVSRAAAACQKTKKSKESAKIWAVSPAPPPHTEPHREREQSSERELSVLTGGITRRAATAASLGENA